MTAQVCEPHCVSQLCCEDGVRCRLRYTGHRPCPVFVGVQRSIVLPRVCHVPCSWDGVRLLRMQAVQLLLRRASHGHRSSRRCFCWRKAEIARVRRCGGRSCYERGRQSTAFPVPQLQQSSLRPLSFSHPKGRMCHRTTDDRACFRARELTYVCRGR